MLSFPVNHEILSSKALAFPSLAMVVSAHRSQEIDGAASRTLQQEFRFNKASIGQLETGLASGFRRWCTGINQMAQSPYGFRLLEAILRRDVLNLAQNSAYLQIS